MLEEPYELTTLSGADLAVVRRSFAHVTGALTVPNLAAFAALDVPADIKEATILGAVTPGDAGPSMVVRRVDSQPLHAGWVRTLDRYTQSPGVIRNADFSNPDKKDFVDEGLSITFENGVAESTAPIYVLQLRQDNCLTAGVQYNFSFDYKALASGGTFVIMSGGPVLFRSPTWNPDGNWHTQTGSFVADGTTFRLKGDGVNFHGMWDNLLVTPKSGETTSEVHGGYWEYASKNQPVYLEWFGGMNDLYVTSQATGVAGINSFATDNKAPFEKASRFLYVATRGNCAIGPTIQLGYGGYYISDTPDFDRALTIQGMGSGYQNTSTRIVVAAGKTGLFLKKFSGGQGVQGTIRDLEVRSLGFGGSDTAHGIDFKCTSIVENCSIMGFGGHGINIDTDVGIGEGANCSRVKGCAIFDNKKSGIFFYRGDSNACHTDSCSFINNKEWGIEDRSFLANAHHGHHASTNGNLQAGTGGPFYAEGINGPTTFIGCYSEGDQMPSYAGVLTTFIGGLHGAGVEVAGGIVQFGQNWVGGIKIEPRSQYIRDGDECYLRLREGGPNVLWEFGTGRGLSEGAPFDFRYVRDYGFVLQYANLAANFSYGITPGEGNSYRNPRIKANHFMLPKGVFIGSSIDQMRYLTWSRFGAGPAIEGNVEYKTGDVCFDDAAGSLGWICSAGGITTDTTWTSGTEYNVGAVVRTGTGKVYELTRKPYDPDAWTMPGSTVMPTHTTLDLEVSYPEPNPHIDPGEGTTIPGYTWVPPAAQVYTDWIWHQGQIYGPGYYVYAQGPNLYYQCTVGPTAPARVMNQVWAMPKSTVEPTHTSGVVHYPEPNPSPSGTEPGTIPGYVWSYVSSSPAAVWSRVGQRFATGIINIGGPTVNAGVVSTDFTISVPGAAMGDTVTVGCNADLDELNIINARVSATNTIKFKLHNFTTGSITLPAVSFYASAVRHH